MDASAPPFLIILVPRVASQSQIANSLPPLLHETENTTAVHQEKNSMVYDLSDEIRVRLVSTS